MSLKQKMRANPSPHELRGVLPVFQTPWLPDETLDLETFEREIA